MRIVLDIEKDEWAVVEPVVGKYVVEGVKFCGDRYAVEANGAARV